jgi:hypothetical protein
MTTYERNRKMTANQISYHSSLIRKPAIKAKRSCVKCKKMFMSNSSSHRSCNVCVNERATYGERAYISM